MTSKDCNVTSEVPPNKENPLPKYGELFQNRQLKKAKTGALSKTEQYRQKKRVECKADPLKDTCIPKEIILPFTKPPETAGKYVEFDARTGTVKVRKGKIELPGWLIELTDQQLQSTLECKKLLATGKDICELLGPFHQSLEGLGSDLSVEDVVEILRRCPNTPSGWSFSHFMFIAGNPSYAKKKGAVQEPLQFDIDDCVEEDSDEGFKPKVKTHRKKNVVDRLYELPQLMEPDDWPPNEEKKGSGDKSGSKKEYSLTEKLFYSALLYTEMYETLETINNMYAGGVSIPEPTTKSLKRARQAGFGAADIGYKKIGFVEWDKPPPPLPKTSPYIADIPLVSKRMKIVQPSQQDAAYMRSKTSFQPLFLSVKAPPVRTDPIRVTEDARRLKSILEFLASQGNCLALLPDVHSILHLSDALLDKLEKVNKQSGPVFKRVSNRSNECDVIKAETKKLFQTHGLPKEVAEIPGMINYALALQLREICTQLRNQRWAYISSRKPQFRKKVWQMMHVEQIPCGNLRESFVYSFQAYLPEASHLPIVHNNKVQ